MIDTRSHTNAMSQGALSQPSQKPTDVQTREPGRVMAVISDKGGVGKTTCALNLAGVYLQAGLRVCVVDLDPSANATIGLGCGPRVLAEGWRTSAHALLRPLEIELERLIMPVDLSAATRRRVPRRFLDGMETGALSVLPSSRDLEEVSMALPGRMGHERFARILTERLRDDFDIVIIDTPASLGLITRMAMIAADGVTIVTRPELFSWEATKNTMATLRYMRELPDYTNAELIGVLFNIVDARYNLTSDVREMAIAESVPMLDAEIPKTITVAEAVYDGLPYVLMRPEREVSIAFRGAGEQILARMDSLLTTKAG